jgi:hypothetical protein
VIRETTPDLRTNAATISAATAALFLLLLAVAPARAETVVLRNGQRLAVTGYQREGTVLRLHVAGGEVTLPADDVVRIEPEEYFPPTPPPKEPPLDDSIRQTAARHRIDPALLTSVIAVESNFDPRAVSPKHAQGLMQLMPGTSGRMGVADVFNPAQNLEGGARYLRQLLDRYGQNLPLALAAYNAGPGRVDRAQGVPAIRETRLYVSRVMKEWHARTAKTERDSTQSCDGRTGVQLITVEDCHPAAESQLQAVRSEPAAPGRQEVPDPPLDPR